MGPIELKVEKNNYNIADGDFLTLSGIRLFKDFDRFGIFDATFAYSYGVDYQFNTNKIYNGFSTMLLIN